MKEIYLAAGCFWGAQKYFDQFRGVIETEVGYANGNTENPSYEDVKYLHTGHAETLKIVYDEEKISLDRLLDLYFLVIDPASLNKQGEDEGVQYRTGIYYTDEKDIPVILSRCEWEQKNMKEKLMVEFLPLESFYRAEEYHQKYLDKNPGGYCHIGKEFFTLQEKIDRGEFCL